MTDIVISIELRRRIIDLILIADRAGAFGEGCPDGDPCEVCQVVEDLVIAWTSDMTQPGQQFGSFDPLGTDRDSQRRTSERSDPHPGAPEL